MDNTKWMQSYVRKHHFSVLTHLNPVFQSMKTRTKFQDFCIIFILDSTVSQKMYHFDISFACSIFSKSWEVTNYGFLGVAHLPLSHKRIFRFLDSLIPNGEWHIKMIHLSQNGRV